MVIQGKIESLKKFVTRYIVKYVNIPNCTKSIAILVFRMGLLQGSDLKKDLATWPPCNMEEVMSTTRGYLKLKEEEAQHGGEEFRGRIKSEGIQFTREKVMRG